jgi:hypothetical protein
LVPEAEVAVVLTGGGAGEGMPGEPVRVVLIMILLLLMVAGGSGTITARRFFPAVITGTTFLTGVAPEVRGLVMVPDPPATISSSKIIIKTTRTGSPGMPSPAPPPVSTTATSASGTNDAVSTTQCTTVMKAGTGSSLLRDALMLPKSPLPRAIISLNNNVKGTTFLHHNYASLPLLRDEHRESTSANKAMVKTTSINPHTSIPTTIALPQTPVPLNQLTSMANSSIQYAVSTSSPLTPPSSFSSTSSLLTEDEDEDFNDIKEELNLDDLDEIMLMGLMESKTPSDNADLIVKNEPPGSTTSVGDAIADLPLLDQSEDPYLNDGSDPLSSVLFGSDELDSTVHKWMEACESNL